jgi:hypothetical protein
LIKPDDFIEWAKKDIKGGNRRSIANALTNTKRAIHARIDEILYALRVQYANDWPRSPRTSEKLKVLKRLSIPVTSIVEVLTNRRNELEHSYLLPSLKQVKADVETTELWIEKSKSYLRPSVVLTGLSVNSIGCSASATTKTSTFKATFAEPNKVEFYWDAKKEIVTLLQNGEKDRKNYSDFNWKDLVSIQKKLYLSDDNHQVVPSISVATKLYKAYENWVLGKRGPSFKVSTKFS